MILRFLRSLKNIVIEILLILFKVSISFFWVFLVVFFTFPSWIMKYFIELPGGNILIYLRSEMITTSGVSVCLIASLAIPFFIWFDFTSNNIKGVGKNIKWYIITILALFSGFISLVLWVLSSSNINLQSAGNYWISDSFKVTLNFSIVAMWFFLKYLGFYPKPFSNVEKTDIPSERRGEINNLEIYSKK